MKRIIKLLQYQNRSQEDLEELSELFTEQFSFVNSIKNQLEHEFLKFFKSLKVETHKPMKTLFEAGEIGRKIYFILEGQVAIFLPPTNFKLEQLDTQTQYYSIEDMAKKKYKTFKLIKYLSQGTHFGEIALQNKCVRTASVVVADTLIVATLCYDVYQKLVHQAQLKINEIQLNYLKGVSLFEGWNDSQLMIIMRNCEFKEYRPFEYVFRCNDKVDYIYFIIQGEIRFSIYKYIIEVDMIRKIQKKIMSISLLTNNQYFGDFEIYQQQQQQQNQDQLQEQVNQLKRYSDAFTQSHCKIYRLQMQQFLDNYSTFSDLNKPKKMFIKLNKHRQSMQEIRAKIIQQKQFIFEPNTLTSRKDTSNFQIPRRIPTIPVRLMVQGRQKTNTLDYSTNRSKSNDFFNPERLKTKFGYVTAIANDSEPTIINCQRIRLLNSKIERRKRAYSLKQ